MKKHHEMEDCVEVKEPCITICPPLPNPNAKFRNHTTEWLWGKAFHPSDKSLTIPGQVLSIKEIRERFARGQSVMVYPGVYESDMPMGYENWTKTEKLDYAKANAMDIIAMRNKLIEQEREEERLKREAEIEAELKRREGKMITPE